MHNCYIIDKSLIASRKIIYIYYQVDLAALDACQHCLQKSFRQQPRHSSIHSKVILRIHLLMSSATLPCLPIYSSIHIVVGADNDIVYIDNIPNKDLAIVAILLSTR